MEIADAFIINKADRDGADTFANNLKKISQQKNEEVPIFKTIASEDTGIAEVVDFIRSAQNIKNSRKEFLLADKAYKLITQKRMADIDRKKLRDEITEAIKESDFNLYSFIEKISG